jgi:hypothetical protein
VYLSAGTRVHVLTSELEHVRSFDLRRYNTLAAVLRSGIVISVVPLSANEKSMPLTRYNAAGGNPVGFGSPDSLPAGACVSCEQRNVHGSYDRTSVWLSRRNEYSAQQWGEDGQLVSSIVVENSSWFEGWNAQPSDPNPLTAKPRSTIHSVSADSAGLLWVTATAAPSDWKAFAGATSGGVVVAGARAVIRPELLNEEERAYLIGNTSSVLEVIDARTRRVVASRQINGSRYYPLEGNMVYSVSRTPGGGNSIEIFRMVLKRPAE